MRLIFLILFLISSSFAIGIDKTWYETKKEDLTKLYAEQTKKLSSTKNDLSPEDKEQVEYQLLLIKKIESILKEENTFVFKNIEEITSVEKYIEQVKEYLKTDINYNSIKNEFAENNNKMALLEEQIDKLTVKDDIATVNSQLLYAFYNLKNKQNKSTIDEYEKYQTNFRKILLDSLESSKFVSNTNLQNKIEKSFENFNDLIKEEKKLSLAFDKAKITENEGKIKNLEIQLEQLEADKAKLINQIIYLKIEELLPLLKNKKSEYFDLNNNLQIFIKENNANYESLNELFKYLSRERLGVTKTTFADTKQSFLDIIKYGWTELNNPIIPIGDGVSILAITKFLLIFIFGFSLATFYKKKISSGNANYLRNTSIATRTMLANLGYYFLVAITFVFGLKSVGIDLSSLTILVGALSVGIGFGLQNIVSNFISGIILIFEKSIQVGHIIEIGTGVRGKVSQINMRSSVITTFDNIDIIIPNATLIQSNVTNLTFSDDIRRLSIPFGIAYGCDIDYVIKTILDSLSNSSLTYIRNTPEKAPKVRMTLMGTSSIDFELLAWISENPDENGVGSSNMSDFLIFIYKTLQENNIEIPFPQMDIHIKKGPVV
ncbi:MAG: mechanosensitive ion channel [Aliarcobacter sp.]|mgnify:CR=1 FL=1|jgi:small-conductance mechanosensitive channel|nr:mechanosensitive ion channel [Aliarcobacter sp.]